MKKKTIVITIIGLAAFIGGILTAGYLREKHKWDGLDDGWDYEDEDECEDADIAKEFGEVEDVRVAKESGETK